MTAIEMQLIERLKKLPPNRVAEVAGPNASGSNSDIGLGPVDVATRQSGPPCSQSSCRQRPHGMSVSPSGPTHDTATNRPPPPATRADTIPHSAHSPTP